MKTYLSLLSGLLLLAGCGDLEDLGPDPDEIIFDGETFTKAFHDQAASGPFTEYVRSGEEIKTWTKLVSIYHFPDLTDPQTAAAHLAETVTANNPEARSASMFNETTGEAMVDFALWTEAIQTAEFNIWKFRKAEAGGLIALQFAQRASGDQLDSFFKKLPAERPRLLNVMAGTTF